jgi:hypothetical protein
MTIFLIYAQHITLIRVVSNLFMKTSNKDRVYRKRSSKVKLFVRFKTEGIRSSLYRTDPSIVFYSFIIGEATLPSQ